MFLYEKYRPRTWGEVVAQDAVLDVIERHRHTGLGGKAFWVSGPSGTGKTTIARLIAGEMASSWCIEECDAGRLTADTMRDWEHRSHLYGMGRGGWAFIVNEAHGLRKDTMRTLLVMLEAVPAHVVWVFTTTNDGQAELFEDAHDAPALLSRCVQLGLARRDLAKPFAERCKAIAWAEGLDGQPIGRYMRLLQNCHNNMRAALQAVESGEMVG